MSVIALHMPVSMVGRMVQEKHELGEYKSQDLHQDELHNLSNIDSGLTGFIINSCRIITRLKLLS